MTDTRWRHELDATPTPRELQVLQGAADGLTSAETAARLGLAVETVKTYRRKLLVRLASVSMTQAVAVGMRRGLIE